MYRTYLNEGNSYIIERANTEYSRSINVLQFILYMSITGEYIIPEGIAEYWFTLSVEKHIQRTQMHAYVLNEVYDATPDTYEVSPYYDYIDSDIQGNSATNYSMRPLRYSYSDDLVGMYPERLKRREDSTLYSILAKEVTFQITDACNLACSYCYQICKGQAVMTKDTIKKVLDGIIDGTNGFNDYIDPEYNISVILDFIGGEPLLQPELIDYALKYFLWKTIILKHEWALLFEGVTTTNGTLYFDPYVQQIIYQYSNCFDVNVTVDGTKELHDKCRRYPDGRPTYDIAHKAAIDVLIRRGKAGTKITLAPDNIQYLHSCLQAIINDGFTHINANTVYEQGWTIEHAKTLYQQIKDFTDWFIKHPEYWKVQISLLRQDTGTPLPVEHNNNWCGGNGNMLAVNPYGNLSPCLRYFKSSLGADVPEILIGSADDGYCSTCEAKECIKDMNAITRRSQSEDSCFYCVLATGCAWCTAHNYQATGTPNKRVTYSCEIHKARSLGTVYFHNMLAKLDKTHMGKNLFCPEKWAIPIIGRQEYKDLVELTYSIGRQVNTSNKTVCYFENYGDLTMKDDVPIDVLERSF